MQPLAVFPPSATAVSSMPFQMPKWCPVFCLGSCVHFSLLSELLMAAFSWFSVDRPGLCSYKSPHAEFVNSLRKGSQIPKSGQWSGHSFPVGESWGRSSSGESVWDNNQWHGHIQRESRTASWGTWKQEHCRLVKTLKPPAVRESQSSDQQWLVLLNMLNSLYCTKLWCRTPIQYRSLWRRHYFRLCCNPVDKQRKSF